MRNFNLLIKITLFAGLLVVVSNQTARADEAPPLTPDRAYQAALDRLNIQVEQGYVPDWAGAVLDEAVRLYDLSGAISAYLFPVNLDGQNSGYLIVAAVDVSNPVLEFSLAASPPFWTERTNAKAIADANGMEVCDERPLYFGPLSYGYELAPVGECENVYDAASRYAIDLLTQTTIVVDRQQAQIPLVEYVDVNSDDTVLALDTPMAFKEISGVPDYCQFQVGGCWSGCAPTASANVLGYWDSHGYPNLQPGGDWQQLVLSLAGYMSTDCGSTNIGNISPGMVNYANSKGYYFASTLDWPNATYELFRSEINANRPIVVDLIDAVEYWGANHSVTGIGYQTDGSYMIVNNALACGMGHDHYIHYGSSWYSSIGMHPTSPDSTPPSKASNVRPNGWSGPYTSDSTPSFAWDAASDQQSGMAGYYVAVDDWTPEGSYSNDWWVGNVTSFTLPDSIADGEHIFAVTSEDNAGNRNPTNTNQQGDAPYYTFYVDTTAPSNPTTISSGCGAQDNVWQNTCEKPDFSWSGADDHGGSGVQGYLIYWGTDPGGTPDIWVTNASYSPDTIHPSDGYATYYLRVATRDQLGHTSDPETVFVFRYDGASPEASPNIAGQQDVFYSVNVGITPNGSDAGSGLDTVMLSHDGTTWEQIDYIEELSWDLQGIDHTWNHIYLRLKDKAGNLSDIYNLQACLDLTPPNPSSSGYRLWSAGATSGGGQSSSSNFRLSYTVAQTSSGQRSSSSSFQFISGFQNISHALLGPEPFETYSCSWDIYLPTITR